MKTLKGNFSLYLLYPWTEPVVEPGLGPGVSADSELIPEPLLWEAGGHGEQRAVPSSTGVDPRASRFSPFMSLS